MYKEFREKNFKVRDHDHYTGEYRGAACNKCNMNFHSKPFIPVFCHNMSGYDSHLFLKTIGYEEGRLSCIPHNEERYIIFSRRILGDKVDEKYVSIELRFLDSYKFMSSSLKELASYLPKELFIETKEYFKDDVFLKKGVFPYEYITSFEKYNDILKLKMHIRTLKSLKITSILLTFLKIITSTLRRIKK